jgi:hypothetical protein
MSLAGSQSHRNSHHRSALADELPGPLTLPHSIPVPLFKLIVRDLAAHSTMANNPITSHGSAVVASVKVYLADQTEVLNRGINSAMDLTQSYTAQCNDNHSRRGIWSFEPLVSLPSLSVKYTVNQISTLGRFIDGKLDRSCFEIEYCCGFGCLSVEIRPVWDRLLAEAASHVASGHQFRFAPVWQASRLLDHLFKPQAPFSRVCSHGITDIRAGRQHAPQAESKLRFGDGYEIYPRRLNVVDSVGIGHRPVDPDTSNVEMLGGCLRQVLNMPDQISTVQMRTSGTQCCVSARISVPEELLVAYADDRVINVATRRASYVAGANQFWSFLSSDVVGPDDKDPRSISVADGGQLPTNPKVHVLNENASLTSPINVMSASVGSILGWVSLSGTPALNDDTYGTNASTVSEHPSELINSETGPGNFIFSWEHEREGLLQRIAQLEAENMRLKGSK